MGPGQTMGYKNDNFNRNVSCGNPGMNMVTGNGSSVPDKGKNGQDNKTVH